MRKLLKEQKRTLQRINLSKHSLPSTSEKNSALKPKGSDPVPQENGTLRTITAWSGPTPHPEILAQYEQLVPGTAKTFLNEPHIEAEHRRKLESDLVAEKINSSKRGQIMAFILAIMCILGSFGAIYLGFSVTGLAALLASIGVLVGVFYYSRNPNVNSSPV